MDFPEPEGPTIAVACPALILKLASIKTGLCSAGAVGYLKVTLSNEIPSSNFTLYEGFVQFFTSGSRSITSKMSEPSVLAAMIA